MDVTKWFLTFVIVCAMIIVLSVTYIVFTVNNIYWELEVLQSKHTNMMLRTELCLKRSNHERYKESRVQGSSSKD